MKPAILDALHERHVEPVKMTSGELVGEMRPAFRLDVRKITGLVM